MSHERLSLQHTFDTGFPFLAFFIGYHFFDVGVGSAVALAVACLIAVFRVRRGERLVAVALGVVAVAVSAALAIWAGEGRTFFAPGVLVNVIGLIVTLASLIARRPITGIVGKYLKRETANWYKIERRYRVHQRITWFWVALWVWHLGVLIPLYAYDNVGALAFVTTFILKPSVPLWLIISLMWGARTRRADAEAAAERLTKDNSDSAGGHA